MRVGGDAQVFSGACGRRWGLEECFGDQIAPRIVGVGITPELLHAAQHSGGTVCSRILSRSQPVQRVIGKSFVSVGSL